MDEAPSVYRRGFVVPEDAVQDRCTIRVVRWLEVRNQAAQVIMPIMSSMFAPGQCIILKSTPTNAVATEPKSMAGRWTSKVQGPGLVASRIARVMIVNKALDIKTMFAAGQCRNLNRMPRMKPAMPIDRMVMVGMLVDGP